MPGHSLEDSTPIPSPLLERFAGEEDPSVSRCALAPGQPSPATATRCPPAPGVRAPSSVALTSLLGAQQGGFLQTGFPPTGPDPCPAQAATVCILSIQQPVSLAIAESPSPILRLAVEATAPAAGATTLTLGFYRGWCHGPPLPAPGDVPPSDGGGGSGGLLRTYVYAQDASVPDVSLHEKRILVYGREPSFHRGDANDDGRLDISDPLRIVGKLFLGGVTLGCRDAADANDDARFDISDAISLLSLLFLGGAAPPAPGPPGVDAACGPDSTRPAGDLGCEVYESCP